MYNKITKKDDTKTRHRQMTPTKSLRFFGNLNPARHLSFGCLPQIQVERIGVGG